MHLVVERATLPQLFAFVHPNYSRYLTYQHIENSLYIKHIKLGSSVEVNFIGDKFSTKHGGIIIETTVNREVKVPGGPMQGGYSTYLDAINIFVKNSSLLAKQQSVLKERIHLLTSSKHRETTLLPARNMKT